MKKIPSTARPFIRMVMRMVYEAIGKTVLYIIGTLLGGAFISAIDDDDMGVFCGAWIVGILVFLCLIIPPTT